MLDLDGMSFCSDLASFGNQDIEIPTTFTNSSSSCPTHGHAEEIRFFSKKDDSTKPPTKTRGTLNFSSWMRRIDVSPWNLYLYISRTTGLWLGIWSVALERMNTMWSMQVQTIVLMSMVMAPYQESQLDLLPYPLRRSPSEMIYTSIAWLLSFYYSYFSSPFTHLYTLITWNTVGML